MQREQVPSSLSDLAFEFFFWFSRFEFALKEAGFLQSHKIGATADPGWNEFISKYEDCYVPSEAAQRLLELSPRQQIVGPNRFEWRSFPFKPGSTTLMTVAQLLKIVRNNLFHGGKHGGDHWDDPERTGKILIAGRAVLDDLAALAAFEGDYRSYY